jgi:hypothetical protein
MKRSLVLAVAVLFVTVACSADIITYGASLSGANESPANGSPATGFATVTIDNVAHTLQVDVTFAGLVAPDTASHIHCCTAAPGTGVVGVATVTPTFTGFPTGVTSGTYSHLFDLTLASSWNAAFITANGGTPLGAEAALFTGLAADEAYLNIHSQTFPGGEIRGFLVPVPEPASMTLMAGGVLGLLTKLRKRRA